MKDRSRRLLELLNFYGNTFARFAFHDRADLGETAVVLVRAILGYRQAALVLRGADGGPELVSTKGVTKPRSPAIEKPLADLWQQVDEPRAVGPDRRAGAWARELGLGKAPLAVPVRGATGYQEARLGILIAADPREEPAVEVDLVVLDLIGSLVAGGILSSEARADLRRSNEELESRVQQRTFDLATANRELESFCYSVSHDLRGPLRAIEGFTQILFEDCADRLDHGGKHHLSRIRAGAQRMGQLIDDLLHLSRVVRVDLRGEPFEMDVLAGEVFEALRATDPNRSVEITVEPLGKVTADPRLLRIVLENLLGNAWKFTQGRAPARIHLGVEERGLERVYFVRDNGVGFDMRYVDKLFEPFQRLHSFHEFAGTGIGLSLVQRIIHRHGGEVWAEGVVGQGATVYFTLGEEIDPHVATEERDHPAGRGRS